MSEATGTTPLSDLLEDFRAGVAMPLYVNMHTVAEAADAITNVLLDPHPSELDARKLIHAARLLDEVLKGLKEQTAALHTVLDRLQGAVWMHTGEKPNKENSCGKA